MMVASISSLQGNTGIAIGNAIGSNIANIALVLGVAALIKPMTVQSQTLNREFPLMLLVMLSGLALIWDGWFSRVDGLILLAGMTILVVWIIHLARSASPDDTLTTEFLTEISTTASTRRTAWMLFSGLVLLLVSSRMMVWGAVNIANTFGISDLVVGLTIVAVGTSLPELAATIAAARKGEHDIAIGTVVGSNMFNILAVFGIAGAISPGEFDAVVLTRDFPLMIGLTIALYLMARGMRGSRQGRIQRWEGAALLMVFVVYQVWIFFDVAPGITL
jgi:cation:H+ antiporter